MKHTQTLARLDVRTVSASVVVGALALSYLGIQSAYAAQATVAEKKGVVQEDVAPGAANVAAPLSITINKSTRIHLPAAVSRMSVGNPAIADVVLISPRELYFLGKRIGSTNIILWTKDGGVTLMDLAVGVDTGALEENLRQLLPSEKGIKVAAASDSVILTGVVSDALKATQAEAIAEAYVRNLPTALELPIKAGESGADLKITQTTTGGTGGGRAQAKRVVNLLRISAPQQVMLEVKVAEIAKTLIEKLGSEFGMDRTNGSWQYGLFSSLPGTLAPVGGTGGILTGAKSPTKFLSLDMEREDGLIKILAEPNIMAISGQEASFRAGGKIFIPVERDFDESGRARFTLEEKEFGVGLTFTPTVLEEGRINLKVMPEVTELVPEGAPFASVNNVVTVFPSMTVRRASTTVQLGDGQSFAIAGLIKNNVNQTIKRIPLLGDIPILGALFRSTKFQEDKTELMFVVTPRLVKPLPPNYALPTDSFVRPSSGDAFLRGKQEGSSSDANEKKTSPADDASSTKAAEPGKADPSGFQMK